MPVAEGLSRLRPDGNPRGAPTLKASPWQQDGLLQDVMQSTVREGSGSSSLKTSLQALSLSSEEGTGGPWPGWSPVLHVLVSQQQGTWPPKTLLSLFTSFSQVGVGLQGECLHH